MQIKFPNKPSPEAVNLFCKKIEHLLSAHKLTVSVFLYDRPLSMKSSVNNVPTEELNLWIDKVTVSTPTVKNLEVELFSQGIDEDVSDAVAWHEAFEIQEQLYQHLKRNPGHPKSNDPYWQLWDYLKK